MPRHTRAGCAALLSLQVRARVDRQLAVVWLRTGAATAFAHHGCIRTPTHRPLLVLVYTSYCCCIRLCSVRFLLVLANNYGTGKQKTKQALPFVVLKPTQGSGFSRSVQQQRKKRRFTHIARHRCRCLLYTSPSPRDKRQSRMPSSA